MTQALLPFFDRVREDSAIEAELVAAFLRVVRSGQYILGPEVAELERECARLLGVPHAIGVSSGTDALLLSLIALEVGPGDEVVCPAYSFVATAEVIARVGATPVFVDVEDVGFGVDPAAVVSALSGRTRAVLVAHLFGRCARMDAVRECTGGIPIIEDAAQALGSAHRGAKAGTMGAIGCFSFFPAKCLGGFGDGGLVVTHDARLAGRIQQLRVHGAREKNHHDLLGGNFRLDALQAALLRVKIPHLAGALEQRAAIARSYSAALTEAGLAGAALTLPAAGQGGIFSQYVIRVSGDGVRDRLRAFLAAFGIPSEVYYPAPLPSQPIFAARGRVMGELTNAAACAREALALPIFPGLTGDELSLVVERIVAFFRSEPLVSTGTT